MKEADGLFFTGCFAIVLALLVLIRARLKRIEEKLDKMSGKKKTPLAGGV